MRERISTYIFAYTHTYIRIYTSWETETIGLDKHSHRYLQTYIHTCIYTHTKIHTYIHTYIQKRVYTGWEMRTREGDKGGYGYVHIYIHTYMYAYIQTHMQTCIHTYIRTHKNVYTQVGRRGQEGLTKAVTVVLLTDWSAAVRGQAITALQSLASPHDREV